jgi:hypothetical protein
LGKRERWDRVIIERVEMGTYVVAVGPSILNCGFLTTKVQTSSHDLYIDRWPWLSAQSDHIFTAPVMRGRWEDRRRHETDRLTLTDVFCLTSFCRVSVRDLSN